MPVWNDCNQNHQADKESLIVLNEIFSSRVVEYAWYVGYAHEEVIRLLITHLGKKSFCIMDVNDRWNHDAEVYPEDYEEEYKRPDWLEDVAIRNEGIPSFDFLIKDSRYENNLLSSMLRLNKPKIVLLINEAREIPLDACYHIATYQNCVLGELLE